MANDFAYLFAAVFTLPVLAITGATLGWAIVEAFITTIVWPWKDEEVLD